MLGSFRVSDIICQIMLGQTIEFVDGVEFVAFSIHDFLMENTSKSGLLFMH